MIKGNRVRAKVAHDKGHCVAKGVVLIYCEFVGARAGYLVR